MCGGGEVGGRLFCLFVDIAGGGLVEGEGGIVVFNKKCKLDTLIQGQTRPVYQLSQRPVQRNGLFHLKDSLKPRTGNWIQTGNPRALHGPSNSIHSTSDTTCVLKPVNGGYRGQSGAVT